ncbi:MAG: galactitol-1-phosphate 5-dehydrogenase [Flavobacteriaceae bacterium]|nr:MAG: galactitol-1-phosphate 5-dehydrogenase [Flavobacteriaceae bacterium]
MKALVLESYNNLTYKDVENPIINDNEVLVKVKAVGICGSDVHGMDGSTGRRVPPIIMGHEASGIIHEVGNNITAWKPGDRVTFDSTIYNEDDWFTKKGMYNLSDNRMVLGVSCNEFKRGGAFAEYVVIPQHILYKIPENVSFSQAAMTEPAAVALHALNISDLDKNATILVVGSGMVGMFVIQLLKIKGVKTIIAVDTETDRLEKAKQSGADHIFKPDDKELPNLINQITGNRGVDLVFEVVGLSETINKSISLLRKGGALTIIGNLSKTIELPLQAVVTRQLKIQGSCTINGEYEEVLEYISNGKLNVERILSAEAPLEEGASWFDRLYKKEKGLMKVILKP